MLNIWTISNRISPSLSNCLGHVLQRLGAMCVAHLLVKDIEDAVVLAVGFRAADGAELRGQHVEWTAEVQALLHGEAVPVVRHHVQDDLDEGQRGSNDEVVAEERGHQEQQVGVAVVAQDYVLQGKLNYLAYS